MSSLRVPTIFYIFEQQIHTQRKLKFRRPMQWIPSEDEIQSQKEKVFGKEPFTDLVRPCRIGDGIIQLDEDEKKELIKSFNRLHQSLAFFIPASGSGSRMLELLFEYRNSSDPEICGQMEHFINYLNEFAFYKKLPEELQRSIEERNFEIIDILNHILDENGLGFGNSPKGLIPFHKVGPFILTPIQEHLIQGNELTATETRFHFTIQREFEEQIQNVVSSTTQLTGVNYSVSYSEQSERTNSIAFTQEGNVARDENNQMITRPSGHGALLSLLDQIESEVIFIKNIDNIQHFSKSDKSNETWKVLGGLLLNFKKEAKELFFSPSKNGLSELNSKYQFIDPKEIDQIQGEEAIKQILNRPFRVCGMVKNEGQPGGGPFWIQNNGVISKQIIEKAQISEHSDQRNILLKSTHFNPVMIAASPYSLDGRKFNLENYRDDDAFFVVHKKQKGQEILYMEQPGLWNGSMAKWNTVFVEIPSSVFSPVKTILDLLDNAHKES